MGHFLVLTYITPAANAPSLIVCGFLKRGLFLSLSLMTHQDPDQGINKIPFCNDSLTSRPHDSHVFQSIMTSTSQHYSDSNSPSDSPSAQKCANPSALELGLQKKP